MPYLQYMLCGIMKVAYLLWYSFTAQAGVSTDQNCTYVQCEEINWNGLLG